MAAARRSLLFVPGSSPERFGKALKTGADIVCLDLEDSVAPDGKDDARRAALEFLDQSSTSGPERALRINDLKAQHGIRDLAALMDAGILPELVMLPKVDDAAEVTIVAEILASGPRTVALIPVIESLKGLDNARAIATASSRAAFILFGAADFSAELGADLSTGPMAYARSRLVHAAKLAGIGILDVPSLNFRDGEMVRAEAEAARAFGFTGKAVLHPANVQIVNEVFTPTPDQIEEAKRILKAFKKSGSGVTVLDGKLVEAPVIRAMEARLEAARAAGIAT